MKWQICLMGIVGAFAVVGNLSRVQAGESDPDALSRSINSFATDLYGQLKPGTGNLFFSPFSIETALAMVYNGARGQTAQQMGRVMHISGDTANVNESIRRLVSRLNEAGTAHGQSLYTLRIANGLWMQQGFPFNPTFTHVLQHDYEAEARLADFANAMPVSNEINRWVEKQTAGKITNLISPAAIDDLTRLILVNAIYFKGAWDTPFTKEQTRERPFYLDANQSVQVPMMYHSFDALSYMENEQLQMIEMQYVGKQISMVMLLPRSQDGIGALERNWNEKNFISWLEALGPVVDVKVTVPKFKMESEFQLKDALSALGMADAFEAGRADFSGIANQERLALSEVIHKAYVDVNEEGTEAAAATAIYVRGFSVSSPLNSRPKIFRADHPFMFVIRDLHSGAILFMGRVMNPAD